MSTDYTNFINPLLLLFLTISGNFLAPLFPCQVQELFTTSIFHKHILAFFTLFFAIVLANNEINNLKLLFRKTILLYLLFILITRMDKNFFLLFLFILAAKYLLEKQIEDLSKEIPEEVLNNYNKMNKMLQYTLIIIGIIGFLIYLGEKKYEYGADFDFTTFIFGKTICKGTKLKNTSYLNSLRYLF
jgi:hypothetical protein